MFKPVLLSSILWFFSLPLLAQTAEQFKQVLQKKLYQLDKTYHVLSVEPSRMPGFYAVQLASGPLLYVSSDAQYFIAGQLYQLKQNQMLNLTEKDQLSAKQNKLNQLDVGQMIVYRPKAPVQVKTHITVFTDIDCPYCQKLHQEIPSLNAHGIEVRYLAYPRAGIGSNSAKKLISVWCSDNARKAMDDMMQGQSVPDKKCANPVAKYYQLGQSLGVHGTPTIITQQGQVITGYHSSQQLVDLLGV